MSAPASPLARGLIALLLIVGMLGFGGVSLCGGWFTAKMVPVMFEGHGEALALLAISVPSLVLGLVMIKVCFMRLLRLGSRPRSDDSTS